MRSPNAASDPWLVCFKANPRARIRLFCFHHAGGNANVFFTWASALSSEVEVCAAQLPGHGTRRGELAVSAIEPLVAPLANAIGARADLPFVLFGHSMGSLLAFEVARTLQGRGGPIPKHLYVGGRGAPHLPLSTGAPLATCSDEELLEYVDARYGVDSIPPQIRAEPDLVRLFLPALRADLIAVDTYSYRPSEPLRCPITAYRGERDFGVTDAVLSAWQRHTSTRFGARTLPGDHFFPHTRRDAFLEIFRGELLETDAGP